MSSELEVIRFPVAPGGQAALAELIETDGRALLGRGPELERLETALGDGAEGPAVLVLLWWRSEEDHQQVVARPEVQELFGRIAGRAVGPPRLETYARR